MIHDTPRRITHLTAAFVVLALGLEGCTFIRLSDRVAGEGKARKVSMPMVLDGVWEGVHGFEAVKKVPQPERLSLDSQDVATVSFLHISDAQIRDQRAFETSFIDQLALGLVDSAIGPAVRRSVLEQFDSVAFASFLAADAKRPLAPDRRHFIVHTGDLLDLSVASELVESLEILDRAKREHARIYSVAGNHDGLLFGNMGEKLSGTHDFGLNRTEFVLGHVLWDREGYGFASNEMIARLTNCETIMSRAKDAGMGRPWWEATLGLCEALRNFREVKGKFRHREWDPSELALPVAFKNAIHVSSKFSRSELRSGYYDWAEPVDLSGGAIRFVVLDTRSVNGSGGDLDDVQLSWLYTTLVDAYERCQPVIFFAHHGPGEVTRPFTLGRLLSDGKTSVSRQLIGFPNVIAYFHGHGHDNSEYTWGSDRRLTVVETGSTTDFPNAGRQVGLTVEPLDPRARRIRAKIDWTFVHPRGIRLGDDAKGPGFAVQAALDELYEDASRDWGNEIKNDLFNLVGRKKQLELGQGPILVDRQWDAEPPTAETVFGTALARLQELRMILGYAPIPERANNWCSSGRAIGTATQ